jgi:hypothetical protein
MQTDARNKLLLYHGFQLEINQLANDVLTEQPFNTFLAFKIGLHDLNAIKWRTPLGTSSDTAFFAWSGLLVTDVFSSVTPPRGHHLHRGPELAMAA